MKITYYPQNVCCRQMNLEIEDNKVVSAEFIGGCPGNHLGIASLVKGMEIDEVIERLQGITCGDKITSCPDQLAQCLIEYKTKVTA